MSIKIITEKSAAADMSIMTMGIIMAQTSHMKQDSSRRAR